MNEIDRKRVGACESMRDRIFLKFRIFPMTTKRHFPSQLVNKSPVTLILVALILQVYNTNATTFDRYYT